MSPPIRLAALAGAALLLFGLGGPGARSVAGPAEPAPAPRTHVVRVGESLWTIARDELGRGSRWREILEANPGLDPAALRVGQVLRLPTARPPEPDAVSREAASEPASSPLAIAWRNLKAWPGLAAPRFGDLRGDLRRTDRLGGPAPRRRRVLLPADDGDGFLFVAAHVGWKVVLASLAPDLSVRQVEVRVAKGGCSISWPDGLVVTFHEHPGTGLVHDAPVRVRVEKGELRLAPLPRDSGFRPPSLR